MMKISLFFILSIFLILFVLTSCSVSTPKPISVTSVPSLMTVAPIASAIPSSTQLGEAVSGEKYRTITPEQAKDLIGKPNVVLVDVRTPEEYKEANIPGSVLLPLDDILQGKYNSVLSDKNAMTIVYCRSGRRSAIAAAELVKAGYTNVYDLGGIIDWPYETVAGK